MADVDEKNVETTEDTTEVQAETGEKATVAKAGKRSKKAVEEAEELEKKEERKEKIAKGEMEPSDDAPVKKGEAPKTRPKSERRSKSYKGAYAKVESGKEYPLDDAIALALDTSFVKFDATVELHVRLNVDPKQADQNIRSSLVLPEGTGKEVKVAVFGNSDDIKAAKDAGADIAGEAEFLDQLKKEEINFDVLISTPQMMSQLGKYARLLGPKGLMPNPKSGTVTKDVAAAVKNAKAGMVEYRVDSNGIVHLGVGKVSFGKGRLKTNIDTVLNSIKAAKPNSIKGIYVESIYLTSSMGPSIAVTK